MGQQLSHAMPLSRLPSQRNAAERSTVHASRAKDAYDISTRARIGRPLDLTAKEKRSQEVQSLKGMSIWQLLGFSRKFIRGRDKSDKLEMKVAPERSIGEAAPASGAWPVHPLFLVGDWSCLRCPSIRRNGLQEQLHQRIATWNSPRPKALLCSYSSRA
jgi:hypothetical protein